MYDLVCERITEQQENANLAVRAVGSQLKDILRKLGPEACEIVFKDLGKPEMSLSECEKEIHAYADELHKEYKGSCVCVAGDEAERIIKEFYGMDALNSQTLGKLTYTKALKLLALPEEDREAFVEDNDVENMSTRELDRAIKERDEALKKAEKTDELQEAFDTAKNKLSEMEQSLANTKTRAETAQAEADRLSKQLEKAKEAEKKAKEQYKLLKDNPQLSDDAMAKIKAQAEADAAEAFKKQLADSKAEADAKLLKAQRDKETAEWERERAQAQLNDMQKQLEMSDPAVSAFRALFRQAQKSMLDLIQERDNIKDEETKKKLTEAVNALCRQYIKE